MSLKCLYITIALTSEGAPLKNVDSYIGDRTLGFRQFRRRGTAKVSTEWTLVCLAYNVRRGTRWGPGPNWPLAGKERPETARSLRSGFSNAAFAAPGAAYSSPAEMTHRLRE